MLFHLIIASLYLFAGSSAIKCAVGTDHIMSYTEEHHNYSELNCRSGVCVYSRDDRAHSFAHKVPCLVLVNSCF